MEVLNIFTDVFYRILQDRARVALNAPYLLVELIVYYNCVYYLKRCSYEPRLPYDNITYTSNKYICCRPFCLFVE